MEWKECLTASEKNIYIKFMKAHYKEDPAYIDYTTPILKEIFDQKSPFSKNVWYASYLILDLGKLVGVSTYIIHKHYEKVLQIAFLEYMDIPQLPKLILDHARDVGMKKGVEELVVGLNGHVNYGLGLSLDQSHRPTFGSVYTKTYYSAHFKALGLDETLLVSYQYPWKTQSFPLSKKNKEKFYKRFEFRSMQKETYDRDLEIYTGLNNKCFGEHPFYYPRTVEEDRYLFKDLKHFMEKGSLIFAEDCGKPIGFLLWYPDWGEIMKRGETLSIKTYIKKILFGKRVSGFKIVEWAVLPEYRKKGVPIGLLAQCYKYVKGRAFTTCKTSWIVEDNRDSSGFGEKWAQTYERYSVFSMKLKRGL